MAILVFQNIETAAVGVPTNPVGVELFSYVNNQQLLDEVEQNRESKIHVCGVRQTANVSWEFLKIENKQIKTVENDSYG